MTPHHTNHGKNAGDEQFLERLNRALGDFEKSLYEEFECCPPPVHVVGLPRSGTTLLLQVLASSLKLGYISNIAASFWRAPVTGIRLARKIGGDHRPDAYQSTFGRTEGPFNVHEFGYFWRELLGYSDMLEGSSVKNDPAGLQQARIVLGNITLACGCPVLFKSFLAQWHLAELSQLVPSTCVIRIKRDPVDVAYSLLGMRRHYFGDLNQWTSLKPRQYPWLKTLPYWEQVAGQAYFLGKALESQISLLNPDQIFELELKEIRENPVDVVAGVRDFLGKHSPEVKLRENVNLQPFVSQPSHKDDNIRRKIEVSYAEFVAGRDEFA